MCAEMLDKFSDGGFGQGINIIFQEGTWMGIIAKFSEGGNGLGGMSKTQNKVRIGQKNVQMLIKSEI